MSPVVALRDSLLHFEFTSALGGEPEESGRAASASFDANDPEQTLAVRCEMWCLDAEWLFIQTPPREPPARQLCQFS
jgi:hypothetical protein